MANVGDLKIVMTLDGESVKSEGNRVIDVLRQIANSSKSASDSSQNLEKHFTSLSAGFRDIVHMGGMLRFVMYDIRDVFEATFGHIVKASAEMERMTTLMKGLSNASTDQAKAMEAVNNRNFVIALDKNAPFEVKALTDAFIKFKSAGLDPTDGSLKALANSVAKFGGSGETLQRASVAIQQMAGKGVVSMEELRQQLGEAVPTAIKSMATGVGMSMAQLTAQISKGTVEAKTALSRMFAVMRAESAGAGEEMMKTWNGQIEKMKTNFMLFSNNVGNSGGFFATIKAQLNELNTWFQSDEATAFAKRLGAAFQDIADKLIWLTHFVMDNAEAIKTAGEAVLWIWSSSKLLNIWNSGANAFSGFVGKMIAGYDAIVVAENNRVMAANAANLKEYEERKALILKTSSDEQERIQMTAANRLKEVEVQRAALAKMEAQQLEYEAEVRQSYVRLTQLAMLGQAGTKEAAQINERIRLYQGLAASMIASQKSAEAAIVESSVVINAKHQEMWANAMRTNAALAGMGTVAVESASKMTMLSSAVAMMGGPLGIIITLLTVGWTAWEIWGNKGESAAEKVSRALERTKLHLGSLDDAQAIKNRMDTIKGTEIPDIEKRVKDPLAGLDPTNYITPKMIDDAHNVAVKELSDKRKELADLQKNYNDAMESGTKTAIDDAVRLNAQRVQVAADGASQMLEQKRLDTINEINASDKSEQEKRTAEVAAIHKYAPIIRDAKLKVLKENADLARKYVDTGLGKNDEKLNTSQIEAYRQQLKDTTSKIAQVNKEYQADMSVGSPADSVSKQIHERFVTPWERTILDLKVKVAEFKFLSEGMGKETAHYRALLQEAPKLLEYQDSQGVIHKMTLKDAEDIDRLSKNSDELAQAEEKRKKAFADVKTDGERLGAMLAASSETIKDAMNIFDNGGYKEPAGVKNMRKSIATIEDQLRKSIEILKGPQKEEAEKLLADFMKSEDTLIGGEWVKALSDDTTKMLEETDKIYASLAETDRKAKEDEYQREKEHLKGLFDLRMTYAKNTGKLTAAELEKFQKAFDDNEAAREAKHMRDMETPMQKLVRDWEDMTKQMQTATTKWANGAIDVIMNFVKTGKLSIGDFVTSVLEDFVRMRLQKQLGGVLQKAFDGIVGVVTGESQSGNDGASATDQAFDDVNQALRVVNVGEGKTSVATAVATEQRSFLDSVKENLSKMWDGASASMSGIWDKLGGMFDGFGQGLSSMLQGMTSGFGNLFSWIQEAFSGLGSGGTAGAGSLIADAATFFGFANGGIMTPWGPASLRAYANGGIANSPQIAIYGEGSMSEAYVPLPDGKNIPVTLKGGEGTQRLSTAAPNVTVNVYEAPGTKSSVKQTKNADGSFSMDVIIEQIEGKMARNVQAGRGAMSSAMERTYGLNRASGSVR